MIDFSGRSGVQVSIWGRIDAVMNMPVEISEIRKLKLIHDIEET